MKKLVIEDQEETGPKDYATRDERGITMTSKVKRPEGIRYYKSTSKDAAAAQKMNRFKASTNPADSVASSSLSKIELEKLK